MSTGKRRVRFSDQQRSGASSGSHYEVGYGKPPREHRFKPGQSGNRKGRPKGTKNTAILLEDLFNRKIEVRTGGSVRKISLREAMLTRFAEAALKGDVKAATFLLQLEEQQKGKSMVRHDIMLKSEEDVRAALLQRGLPETILDRLEFHDSKLIEPDTEPED